MVGEHPRHLLDRAQEKMSSLSSLDPSAVSPDGASDSLCLVDGCERD